MTEDQVFELLRTRQDALAQFMAVEYLLPQEGEWDEEYEENLGEQWEGPWVVRGALLIYEV